MQYFFVLGNHQGISAAELAAVLSAPAGSFELVDNQPIVLYNTDIEIKATELIGKLGGTIKIGEVVEKAVNVSEILPNIKKIISNKAGAGKLLFGFSSYIERLPLKQFAMETKKFFKELEISSRWVVSRDPILSSVVVEQNGLVDQGVEISFFKHKKHIYIGKTLAVQPFKELSRRDYGRPARDDHSGMLPPKLAQIMINLAKFKEEKRLLDPFCGSGTIINEALLMGGSTIYGSDLSEKAVADTKENYEWLLKIGKIKPKSVKIFNASATSVSSKMHGQKVDVIVTEPFLGPQRGHLDLRKIIKELEGLYQKSLEDFSKILAEGGRIVMLWPVFWQKREPIKLNSHLAKNYKIIDPLTDDFASIRINKTERKTLLYGREGQRVWREIVILEKK
ncbi:methyltransferase domain-containing protein [Candidatus Falkowbacteria bacterium]|nr:methyltransferase domain-containing protein [Candidatus Falkowbacteria bacterium]